MTLIDSADERVDELDDYHVLPQARMKMRELLDGEYCACTYIYGH